MQSRIQSIPESLSSILVRGSKDLYFFEWISSKPCTWSKTNKYIYRMIWINYFFNMSVMSLYSSRSFLSEFITIAKLLSGNMTTSTKWLLQDYKNRSHFLLGLRRTELCRIKRVTHQKKLAKSCKRTICRPCSG